MTIQNTSACVRGCTMYRVHLVQCEDKDACPGCLPQRAEHGRLCHTCHRRLELMLADAPTVYRWLTGNLTSGQGAARAHEDYERGGTPDLPTPLKLMVLDQRDLMADQLTEWVDDWCDRQALRGPARHSVAADSSFLLTWLATMEREEWIGDWWEALAETISQAHALAPWRPAVRRIKRTPCPGCGETNLVIYGGESDVTCQSCRIIMTEDRFELWERVLKADEAEAS